MDDDPDAGWTLTPHVCRLCLARVLRQGDKFRCSTCSAAGSGDPASVCACGIGVMGAAAGRSPGRLFRCTANPAPGPSNPAVFVVGYGAGP